jgi:hypothetical protein
MAQDFAAGGYILPQNGIRYYLYHIESGKYVHPEGGSDAPNNNTPLVFHSDKDRLALQYVFNNSQLQHYSSGKYVHPYKGSVGVNVMLVLFDGSDGNRTAVGMVSVDGRTYLKKDNYWVHPNGGSANPDNNTRLVYHTDFRPALAIGVIPAETCELLSITYDNTVGPKLPVSPVVVETVSTNFTNENSFEQTMSVEYSRSLANTFSYEFSEKLGFQVTNKVKSSFFVAGAEVSVTASFEFLSSQTTTTTTTEGVKVTNSVKVTISPHQSLKLTVTTQRVSGRIPFIAKFKSESGYQFEITGVMVTEYFFNQQVSVSTVG